MTRYLVRPEDLILVKVADFLPFAKNIGKNAGNNLRKNVRRLDHAKQSGTDALKMPQKKQFKKE